MKIVAVLYGDKAYVHNSFPLRYFWKCFIHNKIKTCFTDVLLYDAFCPYKTCHQCYNYKIKFVMLFLNNKRDDFECWYVINIFLYYFVPPPLSHQPTSPRLFLWYDIFAEKNVFFETLYNLPCGHFILWFNVPRGSYCGQRLMTGNYSDILG